MPASRQIRVDDASVPTFTVLLIENTGIYSSSWWWYYGPNSATQGTGRRLISIDPYFDAQSNLQFAVVQVPNTGSQARGWWWYYGYNSSVVNGFLQQNNARLVSLRGYNDHGAKVFAVIMAENIGGDFIESQWYTGITIEEIGNAINGGLRPISLSPNPFGNWDVIFVTETGEAWGRWYGLDYQSIVSTAAQYNYRIVDVSPYILNGNRVFSVVETENSG